MGSPSSGTNRREFLKAAAAAAECPYVITPIALGADGRAPASERIVMGGIGIGGMGNSDQGNLLGRGEVQYVAVCDVRKGVVNCCVERINQRYGNKDASGIVNECWSGTKGAVKSINVNVGRLSQPCYLPAQEVPPGMDWDMWLGPAPWAPYHADRLKRSLKWDPAKREFPGDEEANRLLDRARREPWVL
jgi:hypothetical protein